MEQTDNIRIYYEDGKYVVKNNDVTLITSITGEISLINEDLVIVNDDVINIYQNIKQGLLSTSIISKQGIVLAKPMLYKETIIVVFKNGIVQFDTNLNVVEKLFCEIDGEISQEKIIDGCFIFILTKNSLEERVIYDIENNVVEREKINCDIILLRS